MFSIKSIFNSLKSFIINKFNRKMFFCKQSTFTAFMLCKSFIYIQCASYVILTI